MPIGPASRVGWPLLAECLTLFPPLVTLFAGLRDQLGRRDDVFTFISAQAGTRGGSRFAGKDRRLLRSMGQLVGQQALTLFRVRRIRSSAEDNVIADSVGEGVNGSRGFRCLRVGVDPYSTEVIS